MWSGLSEQDDGVLWDIACPTQPSRLPGLTMAGFRDRGITPPGLQLIPHPAVTLVLAFGGTIAVETATGQQRQGDFVTGLGFGEGLRALRAEAFECLQVRLSPVVAPAVLGAAVADLDGAVVTLDDLLGREAARISEHLGDLSSWEDRFALTEAWLARRCAEASQVAPEVAWAWRGIVASRGMVRVEHLAAELGWSRKRLWSRFYSQIGLPPKRAAKLVRFDHAVHGLVAGQDAASVAADGGYTDQSHLHRDVVAFTGLTPATVVNEPFLAVDDIAWGWPGPLNPRGRLHRTHRTTPQVGRPVKHAAERRSPGRLVPPCPSVSGVSGMHDAVS
jgi:AraC-like DNA-binding protein